MDRNIEMKFWHLASIFRSEKALLETILCQPKWKLYWDNYINLDKIVAAQNRKVLDEVIPHDLAVEICSESDLQFWFYNSQSPKILSSYQFANKTSFELLPIKDAFLKFGGHFIEEALERSYAEIGDN